MADVVHEEEAYLSFVYPRMQKTSQTLILKGAYNIEASNHNSTSPT